MGNALVTIDTDMGTQEQSRSTALERSGERSGAG